MNAFDPLDHEPLPREQVLDGSPTTGAAELDSSLGVEVGVWEITPGTSTDTEVDEVFVVLSGRATVHGVADSALEIGPGSVVRLEAGMRTTWVVHETLRKIYVVR